MLDAHPAPDALARPPLPATAIDPPASPARPVAGDALYAAAPDPAAGVGGRQPARCRDPPGRHDTGLRRVGCFGRLGLEGRLRGRRSRRRQVSPALRQRHARQCGRWAGRAAPHAGDAACTRGAGAIAHETLRGADSPPAVLDPAAARLRRAPGRRDPAGRYRAGALGRHRHAGRDGGMRPRQGTQSAICISTNTRGRARDFWTVCSRRPSSPLSTPRPSRTGCTTSGPPWC